MISSLPRGVSPFFFETKMQKMPRFEQGSLDCQFWGDQTIQMYGNFGDFPYNNALFGLVI